MLCVGLIVVGVMSLFGFVFLTMTAATTVVPLPIYLAKKLISKW